MAQFDRIGYDIEVVKNAGRADRPRNLPHYHNAFEIAYYWRGSVEFFVRDQSYAAGPGDVVFVNTFEIHNRIPSGTFSERTLLIYRPSFLESVVGLPDVFALLDSELGGCRHITLPDELRAEAERTLPAMLAVYQDRGAWAPVYLRAYLTLFLTRIAEHLGTLREHGFRPDGGNARLRDLIRFIREHLDARLDLDTIASRFGTDKYYLCRHFRKHTGLSVMDYVNRMRVVNAEKLIMQNGHSITDIGLMVGFGNITSFDRTFKRYTGISPREYRKNHVPREARKTATGASARSVQSARRSVNPSRADPPTA